MHHVRAAHEHVVCHGCRGARNLILTSGHRQQGRERDLYGAAEPGVGLCARRLVEKEEKEEAPSFVFK